jgi:hypothetical protein
MGGDMAKVIRGLPDMLTKAVQTAIGRTPASKGKKTVTWADVPNDDDDDDDNCKAKPLPNRMKKKHRPADQLDFQVGYRLLFHGSNVLRHPFFAYNRGIFVSAA